MTMYYYQGKRLGPVPGEYNELSGKQLIAIAHLFERKLKEDVAYLEALRILLDMSVFSFTIMSNDAKQRMLPDLKWIFDKNTLTEQVLPSFPLSFARRGVRGEVFYGPKKEFDNLTLAEFHFAEMYYREMVMDKDETALNRLVAVLYRPAKKGYNFKLDSDGDARIPFNANEVAYYAKLINRCPQKVKDAILLFYDGCRQNLLSLYNDVFKGDKGEDNSDGMFGVMRGLAGTTYGDLDKVETLNIHTALNEISLQLKEAEETERKMKAAQK